jgi:catechol 2,3-dioxygenase-like lactoylglutathione lyase family enzyme
VAETYRRVVDHLTIRVADIERSRAFYAAALAPLGFGIVADYGGDAGIGLGPPGQDDFAIAPASDTIPATGPLHLAFFATDHAAVNDFHAFGLSAGGRDNGPPGLRPQYHDKYYAAYLIDPDGNNIEAVDHG